MLQIVGRARLSRLLEQMKRNRQLVTVFDGEATEYWLPRHVELKKRRAAANGA